MTLDAPALRADASRNRGAIICAAAAVFAAHGLNVTLERIAKAAGVGVGTIYRRFPTIEELVRVVIDEKMTRWADRAEQAAEEAAARPWEAFRDYVLFLLAQQADDIAFSDIIASTSRCAELFPGQTDRVRRATQTLVARATAARVLRPDFEYGDVEVLVDANAGVIRGARDSAVRASERFGELMLEAVRASPANE